MVRYTGDVTVKLGEAAGAGQFETISDIKQISWGRRPTPHIFPQTVMNTKNPVGWRQGHKWVEIEIHVLSEAYHAFYHNQGGGATHKAYVVETGDNLEIPYLVAERKDSNGQTWTATFTGAIPMGPDEPYRDGEDVVYVYRLLAKSVSETPPP